MPNFLRLALCACLLLLGTHSIAHAEVSPDVSNTFGGHFRLSNPKVAKADINAAVNQVVDRLMSFKRGTARKRLAPIANPCGNFKVNFPDDKIHFACGELNILSPASGEAVNMVLPSGESVVVQQRVQEGNLVQLFKGKSGTRYNEIVPRSDGSLDLHVQIQSRHLPAAIEYKVNFDPIRRQQARRL